MYVFGAKYSSLVGFEVVLLAGLCAVKAVSLAPGLVMLVFFVSLGRNVLKFFSPRGTSSAVSCSAVLTQTFSWCEHEQTRQPVPRRTATHVKSHLWRHISDIRRRVPLALLDDHGHSDRLLLFLAIRPEDLVSFKVFDAKGTERHELSKRSDRSDGKQVHRSSRGVIRTCVERYMILRSCDKLSCGRWDAARRLWAFETRSAVPTCPVPRACLISLEPIGLSSGEEVGGTTFCETRGKVSGALVL